MSFFSHLGNRLPIYLLILVIGCLMLYYVFVYVPDNESVLNDNGMRVLTNKAHAIIEKYNTYDNAVSSAPVSYLSRWYFAREPNDTLFYVNDQSKSYGRIDFSKSETRDCKQAVTIHQLNVNARIDRSLIPVTEKDLSDSVDGVLRRVWKDDRGTANFVFTPSTLCFLRDKNANAVKNSAVKDIPKRPHLTMKIPDFMENIKGNDFFDDLLLVRVDRNPHRKLPPWVKERAGYGSYVLNQSSLGLVVFNLKDTTNTSGSGIYEASILGNNYKVYYQMVKLRTGLDMYLVGLISKDSFNSEAKKVSVWFLVFCSLGALLLIFSFPVLKLFLLDRGERLSTTDITLGVFSIVLCSCLCLILAMGYYLISGLEMDRGDHELKGLAGAIRSETRREVNLFHDVLNDSLLFVGDSVFVPHFKSLVAGNNFNEVFLLDEKEPCVGYMKDMFTEKGNIPDLNIFPVRVSDRMYFRAFQKNDKLDYFVQSINSFASGKSEVAISKRIKTKDANGIGVITIPLRSIFESGVPAPYSFVLLDEQGDVKFHSDWSQINSENLLSQINGGGSLQAYLRNGVEDFVDFRLAGKDCHGFVVPVIRDWSVLVYFERNWIYNLSAQVFALCLISLFATIIFCMVLHLIIRFDKFNPILFKMQPFLYDWLNPNLFSRRIWWSLFAGSSLMFLLVLVSSFVLESFSSQALFSMVAIGSLYFILLCTLKRQVRLGSKVAFATVIVFSSMLFFVTTYSQPWWHLVFGFTGMVSFVIGLRIADKFKRRNIPAIELSTVKGRNKIFAAYRFFMMAIFLTIVTGPSVGALIHHYAHEKLLITGGFLMEDVRKLRGKSSSPAADGKLYTCYYNVLARDLSEVKRDSDLLEDSDLLDYYDGLFYNLFPKFSAPVQINVPIAGGYIPAMSEVEVSRCNDVLQAITGTSLQHIPTRVVNRHTRLEAAEMRFNASAVTSAILIVAVLSLLCWVLTQLCRKIFYLPRHAAWKKIKMPAYGSWEAVEYGLTCSRRGVRLKHKRRDETEYWKEESNIIATQEKTIDKFVSYWKNLDSESRFFLYDLSEDGVANHSNEKILQKLQEAGVIRLLPRIEFVSLSFAHFVRSGIDIKESQQMERRETKEGRWKQARIVLIITIISALAFVSIAEESLFGRATAVIGSIALLVPNLVTLVGSISKWVSSAAEKQKA
jgi:hypothetical protein